MHPVRDSTATLCPVFLSCTNPALMTNPRRNGLMLFNTKDLSHAKREVPIRSPQERLSPPGSHLSSMAQVEQPLCCHQLTHFSRCLSAHWPCNGCSGKGELLLRQEVGKKGRKENPKGVQSSRTTQSRSRPCSSQPGWDLCLREWETKDWV